MKARFLRAITAAAILTMLSACATPTAYTDASMQRYDKDTEYTVEDAPNGFTVSIYYSRYQMIPESDAVAAACKQALTSIAWDVADKRGRKIEPINEQRIKLSMGRNGLSGITSCSASAPATWASK